MLLVFGSVNIDFSMRMPRFAQPGETVLATDWDQRHGGKGGNQAVAAAKLLSGVPGAVAIAAALGRDTLGAEALANLESHGVGTARVARCDAPTGLAFICIDDAGENSIVVAPGANQTLSAGDLTPGDLGCRVALAQLEVPLEEVQAFGRAARDSGVPCRVLNLSPVPPDIAQDGLDALLALFNVLVVNREELNALAARLGHDPCAGAEPLAQRIATAFGSVMVVTLGAEGGVLARPGQELFHWRATPIQPVDTTGAGDAFAGVLAAALARGDSFETAIGHAETAAARTCLAQGAQGAVPEFAPASAGQSA